MQITFYKSASDDGGAKGDQITSGELNAVFPSLTAANRIDGVTIDRKIWIEPDEDVDLLYGVGNDGLFQTYAFLSASDNDTIGDLTGNERLICALKIVSNTADVLTVEDDLESGVVAVDDYMTVGNEITQVDAITDNNDGTWDITTKNSLTGGDYSGQWAIVQFRKTLTAGTATPLWVRVKVLPLSNAGDDENVFPVSCRW